MQNNQRFSGIVGVVLSSLLVQTASGLVCSSLAPASSLARTSTARHAHAVLRAAGGDDEPQYTANTRPLKFWRTSANFENSAGARVIGVLFLVGQLSAPLLVGLQRMGIVDPPPLNTFTAITNAAMDAKIADGSLNKMVATGWGQGFYFDLVKQYYSSGGRQADWIPAYCNLPEHVDWCNTAIKSVAVWQGGI